MDGLTILGLLCLLAGFIFVGIEMVVPGFSVPGISGIVCLIAGVFLLADTVMEGFFITVIVLALLGILMAVMLYLLSKGKFRSPIILEEEQKSTEGYLSSSDLKYLLGKKGVAMTDLRPTGVGQIDGINFDVISEGNYISAGEPVEIIKVEGSKLIVRVSKEDK
ncbi:MAG: serine protease [Eubacterium sp.]|nr:serine protease [Eubacterium sp.]MDY2595176.1 NfeD family protein [Oliverpabstia sp.]